MDDTLLTLKQVSERTTLSKSEIYRRIAEGSFPKSYPMGKSRVVWSGKEIGEWIDGILGRKDAA